MSLIKNGPRNFKNSIKIQVSFAVIELLIKQYFYWFDLGQPAIKQANKQAIKRIFSDSNNILLWHESEDINQKRLFPKFQLIPILPFQVMHDYVFHCPEMISASFLWGSVDVRGYLLKYANNFKFLKFLKHPLFEISEYAFKQASKQAANKQTSKQTNIQ